MHIIPPYSGHLKWTVRIRIHTGETVKIPGDRDRATAAQMAVRLEMLVRSKANGDLPPAELRSWIEAMPKKLSDRLVGLGLLERRIADRDKPLSEQIKEFQAVVAARKTNTARHAKMQASRLNKLFAAMKITNFSQINEDKVAQTLKSMGYADATRRHHIVAAKDFCKWVARSLRIESPLEHLKPPGQKSNLMHERIPLTVDQFKRLMTYLDGAKRYKQQKTRWTPADRKLVYWTAVKTAYRAGELASLRVRSLALDASPPQVVIRAGDAKNGTAGSVPIPADLASALRGYVEGREPEEKLFPMPSIGNGLLNCFRRDLEGAGIKWDWGKGDPQTIDFHALRTTAICWWLDVDGLSAKRVQILARLKTLALVATYSRNLRLDEFNWLDKGPKLVTEPPADATKEGDVQ